MVAQSRLSPAAKRRAAEVGAALLRDGAGLAGVALMAYGAWLIYPPAGFIAGGAFLLLGALLASRNAE
jgi:hypothetical protein